MKKQFLGLSEVCKRGPSNTDVQLWSSQFVENHNSNAAVAVPQEVHHHCCVSYSLYGTDNHKISVVLSSISLAW